MNVSVIVPAYNVELYLERCIASVFNQDLVDFEVIIINDGSKDNTLALAKELEQKYAPYVSVFDQENSGLSAVRNRGVELAKGKYVIFLDSDDFYNPHCLNELLTVCVSKDLDVLEFGFERNTTGEPRIVANTTSSIVYDRNSFLEKYFFTPYAVNKIIRKKVLIVNNIRFIEGKYMEDDYFSTELYLRSNAIGVNPIIVYNYYDNPKSITKTRNRNHELKVIQDLMFSCQRHAELYNLAKQLITNKLALDNLKERRESIVFFMTIRMLRLKWSYQEIQKAYQEVNFSNYKVFVSNYNQGTKQRIMYKSILLLLKNKMTFKLLCKVNPF